MILHSRIIFFKLFFLNPWVYLTVLLSFLLPSSPTLFFTSTNSWVLWCTWFVTSTVQQSLLLFLYSTVNQPVKLILLLDQHKITGVINLVSNSGHLYRISKDRCLKLSLRIPVEKYWSSSYLHTYHIKHREGKLWKFWHRFQCFLQ